MTPTAVNSVWNQTKGDFTNSYDIMTRLDKIERVISKSAEKRVNRHKNIHT